MYIYVCMYYKCLNIYKFKIIYRMLLSRKSN